MSSSLWSEHAFFSVRREDGDELPLILVEGEVDVATAPQLAEALAPFSAGEVVVVDLCDVVFIDSSGLQALLRASLALGDGLLVACDPGGPVRRLFEVAAVDGILNLYGSRSDAFRATSG